MSSTENIILRLIAAADIICSATLPWLHALTVAAISVCAALLVHQIVYRRNNM